MLDKLIHITKRIEIEFKKIFTPYGYASDRPGIVTTRLVDSVLLEDVEGVFNNCGYRSDGWKQERRYIDGVNSVNTIIFLTRLTD